MQPDNANAQLDIALLQLESAAFNFGQRFILDGSVRQSYIRQTRQVSADYRARVTGGHMPAAEAASQVNVLRNQIMEAHRIRSSDIGRAQAVNLKGAGLSLEELAEKYAQKAHSRPFAKLSAPERNRIYLEIIDSAGRSRPSVNAGATRMTRLGRGLLVASVGIAVYNVANAEDRGQAAVREGAVLGGGFAGGAAGGALAGLACGPGAPLCVTLGAFVGGALGAFGADLAVGWAL